MVTGLGVTKLGMISAQQHPSYVELVFSIVARLTELLPRFQESHRQSFELTRDHYLDLTQRSISSQKSHGQANMIIGITAAAISMSAPFISAAWGPVVQSVGAQVPSIGGLWPASYLAASTEADKKGQLQQLALQQMREDRQSEEQWRQGVETTLRTLCESRTQAARGS